MFPETTVFMEVQLMSGPMYVQMMHLEDIPEFERIGHNFLGFDTFFVL